MRFALFGSATPPAQSSLPVGKPNAAKSRSSSPTVPVILHATKQFEGDVEVFIHASITLSGLLAEQEAKQAAKKKFKYIELSPSLRSKASSPYQASHVGAADRTH